MVWEAVYPYQTLLAQQTEEQGVSHFSKVLEAHRLELGVLHDVFQLVVEELQDTWKQNAAHLSNLNASFNIRHVVLIALEMSHHCSGPVTYSVNKHVCCWG